MLFPLFVVPSQAWPGQIWESCGQGPLKDSGSALSKQLEQLFCPHVQLCIQGETAEESPGTFCTMLLQAGR